MEVCKLKIWNYNRMFELEKGVSLLEIYGNNEEIYLGKCVLRKGIGKEELDFG